MTEEEQYLWEKNIKPGNKHFWLTKLKWRIGLIGHKKKEIKTISEFGFNFNLIYKAMWILIVLMGLQMLILIVKETVYLVYPNYGNNTQIIRDFLIELGAK